MGQLTIVFNNLFSNNVGSKRNLEAGIATGVSVAGILIAVVLFCCFRKYSSGASMIFWKNKNEIHQDVEAILKNCGTLAPKRYSYSDVKNMTNSFKQKLGQGGFGGVYKGKLKNDSPIAVKVLNESKGNGEEFINEVTSISGTSHVNIVSLLGFCFEGHRRALIYQFMPNGSLEKSISDFGLAKLCPKKESIISMLGTRGTTGYIAPEVFSRNFGGVSHKSDVYSYGMMILEMAGGRKNVHVGVDHTSEIYFPDWIYKRLELDEEIGQHGIMNEEDNEKARKMIIVGLWCIQTDPSSRPAMSKAVDMLEGSIESMQIPPRPFLSPPPRAPIDSSTIDNLALCSSDVCSQNHC
ncbi:hypothetical protein ACSBR2_006099 [Camellia fascicularis]